MTDNEFELLDALYFTVSFNHLKNELAWEEIVLKKELEGLIRKGWAKCLNNRTEEEIEHLGDFDSRYLEYNYLATKQGLLEHNSR